MNSYDEKTSEELRQLDVERRKIELEREKQKLEEQKQKLEEQKAESSRKKEEHEARLAREADDHESSKAGMTALVALIGTFSEAVPVLKQAAEVWATKYEFGDNAAIKAAACGLIKKAAGENPVDQKEAAERLLKLLEVKPAKG